MSQELGRVLDPEALDASTGPRARARIEVPAAWLVDPCEIDVTLPRRLACARCDGGGCDGCGKSGALRAPDAVEARTVRVHLAPCEGDLALRLTNPFGGDAAIAQIILEIARGESASPGVTRRAVIAPKLAAKVASKAARRRPASSWPGAALIALAATAAILLALFGR